MDLEVLHEEPFLSHAGLLQDSRRCRILWKTRGPNTVQPELPESMIEQMFCCFGRDPHTPRSWLNQVPDLAFFRASQDDQTAEPNEITSCGIANGPHDRSPRLRRRIQEENRAGISRSPLVNIMAIACGARRPLSKSTHGQHQYHRLQTAQPDHRRLLLQEYRRDGSSKSRVVARPKSGQK